MKIFTRLTACLAALTAAVTLFCAAQTVNTETAEQTQAPAETTEETTQENEDTTVKEIKFSDIKDKMPYSDEVYKLAEAGVINGYEDGTFRPDGKVTRAELSKMITLTFNLTEENIPADAPAYTEFTDLKDTDWFKPYAILAKKHGVVQGYENNDFRGQELVTREQVCAILCRIIKPFDLGFNVPVSDKVSQWAIDEGVVNKVLQNMIMPIEENNTFRATEPIKRYELATVLANYVNVEKQEITAQIRFFVGETQWGETETVIVGDYAGVPEQPGDPDEATYFKGWTLRGNDTGATVNLETYIIDGDTDFEAVFLKKTYVVVFKNGSTTVDEKTVEHGQKLPTVTNPTQSGYTFKGWSLTQDGELVDFDAYVVKQDVTLYAIFKENESSGPSGPSTPATSWTVKFMANGSEWDSMKVDDGKKPQRVPDDPENGYMIFAGWSLTEDGDQIKDVASYKVTKNTTFYAVFEENPNDDETIRKFEEAYEDLIVTESILPYGPETLEVIVGAVKRMRDEAYGGVFIDKEYVLENYRDEIAEIDEITDNMSKRDFKVFVNDLLSVRNIDFILDYFGINTSDYV